MKIWEETKVPNYQIKLMFGTHDAIFQNKIKSISDVFIDAIINKISIDELRRYYQDNLSQGYSEQVFHSFIDFLECFYIDNRNAKLNDEYKEFILRTIYINWIHRHSQVYKG